MAEKQQLQWTDFKENVSCTFKNLRESKDFTDVTLACEDGQKVEAHKVILAASSPLFQEILKENKHPHTLIFMRGMKLDDLLSIVDFLYLGEANVYQEKLDSFLAMAEELQLKGLTGKSDSSKKGDRDMDLIKTTPVESGTDPTTHMKQRHDAQIFKVDHNTTVPEYFSGGREDLEKKVVSLMEKSQNLCSNGRQKANICKVCGKEGMGRDIKDHIEANHLEGITLPCNLCGKIFRSRQTLRHHKCTNHKSSLSS